jgi:hypothetical protein
MTLFPVGQFELANISTGNVRKGPIQFWKSVFAASLTQG